MNQLLLSIPEPCHQDWNAMTPTQQGRHCNACAKQVIDFTNMSDTEVLNYFSNIKNDKVCGRAYPDQLERVITTPKEIKRRSFWHWNYITMLFLFFSKNSSAKIHGGILLKTIKTDARKFLQNDPSFKLAFASLVVDEPIGGIISDVDGNPVAFAVIKLKGAAKGVTADAAGHYTIKVNTKYDVLEIGATGYETKEVSITGLHHYDFTLSKAISGGILIKRPRLLVGNVIDPDGNVIAFPSLEIKGSKMGVSGDANGRYVIKVKTNDVLLISATGYIEKELLISDEVNNINIPLEKSADKLGEVVITGLFNFDESYVSPDEPKHVAVLFIKDSITMKPLNGASLIIKKSGSYQTVNATTDKKGIYKLKKIREYKTYTVVASADGYESKEIAIKGNDFDERKITKEILLTKKDILPNRKDVTIRLGGVSSTIIAKPIMYVIDGVLVPNNSLNKLNPNDIEKIDVVNAAEATALYGSIASEGAIIITTKNELAKPVYKILDTVAVKSEFLTKRTTMGSTVCTTISGAMMSSVTVRRNYTDVIKTVTTKISGSLKISPNPVPKGNAINLSLQLKENGAYTIQVINAAGMMLTQQQVFTATKNYTQQLQTNSTWSSGVYYIRLLDTNNKLISTNSFVIQ